MSSKVHLTILWRISYPLFTWRRNDIEDVSSRTLDKEEVYVKHLRTKKCSSYQGGQLIKNLSRTYEEDWWPPEMTKLLRQPTYWLGESTLTGCAAHAARCYVQWGLTTWTPRKVERLDSLNAWIRWTPKSWTPGFVEHRNFNLMRSLKKRYYL